MPTQSNLGQKTKRAFVARMLTHLTIGLGVSTGAAMLAGPAWSQSCDRCAGVNSPICGCETAKPMTLGPKTCGCKCTPKPSLGEKILSHFDRVGDRVEAKAVKSYKDQCDQNPRNRLGWNPTLGCESPIDPNCGCESPRGPSCGCESCAVSPSFARTPFPQSPLPPILSQFQGDSGRFANGSIGDKQLKPTPTTQVSPTKEIRANPGPQKPLITTPVTPLSPEPSVQRVPFEQKSAAKTVNRIPPDETGPTMPSIPNTLKPVPSDPPPTWNANTKLLPTANPAPPASRTPDVLVDPFKDDVSFRGTRDKMEGILLTSDRQVANNALRLAPTEPEVPSRLTPAQRHAPKQPDVSGLQFEAASTDTMQSSQVVPSSYFKLVPVKADVRKVASKENAVETPRVSKMRVPSKR